MELRGKISAPVLTKTSHLHAIGMGSLVADRMIGSSVRLSRQDERRPEEWVIVSAIPDFLSGKPQCFRLGFSGRKVLEEGLNQLNG